MTRITGTTRVAAVIGWPIDHSKSPLLMNAAFRAARIDAVMVPLAVAPAGFAAVLHGLAAAHCLGASVTVPHKLAAAAHCTELAASARMIGAVNCVQLDGDAIIGHNTDADGFADGLTEAGFVGTGKRAVLLGAGGAARAVAYGLRGMRAVEVIARRPEAVGWAVAWPWTAEHLHDACARADLIVDCTTTALSGGELEQTFVASVPLAALRPGTWVTSLAYHRSPLLLDRAASRGLPTLDGRAMLIHQAARAFALWTGASADVAAMERAFDGRSEQA